MIHIHSTQLIGEVTNMSNQGVLSAAASGLSDFIIQQGADAVSYTHLTLPTILLV